jgi:quercetin dioxygenase-like cupin family protein
MLPDGVVVAHLDELSPVPGQSYIEGDWKPVRAHLGIQAFGINAYVADAGRIVVEEHDELNADEPDASHTELYVVLQGRAEFTLGDEQVDGPAGTFVFLRDPAVTRSAVAREDGTTVLAIGAPVGRPFTVSDWESHWTKTLGPPG